MTSPSRIFAIGPPSLASGPLRVIAGHYDDVSGPAHTFSPLNVWDIALNQGSHVTLSQPEGWSTALVVLEGHVTVNGTAHLV